MSKPTTFKVTTVKEYSLDMGGVAPGMIKEMLEQGKGYMMGDTEWSMGDFEMSESTLSVEVEVK